MVAALYLPLMAQPADTAKTIDTGKSVMTVRVLKSGLFSAFGHEHEVRAPIQQGSFRVDDPMAELAVDARQLRVIDKDVSAKDRGEIQETMLGPQVLDSERFPEIRFRSTRVDRLGDGKWVVHGELTLHGQTHPVEVQVEGVQDHFRGSAEIRQKDFGITPVSVGGGAVKVKNEVRVDFEVVGK